MPEQHARGSGIVMARQRVTRERARAARAAGIANGPELLAARTSPQPHALMHTALLDPESTDPCAAIAVEVVHGGLRGT